MFEWLIGLNGARFIEELVSSRSKKSLIFSILWLALGVFSASLIISNIGALIGDGYGSGIYILIGCIGLLVSAGGAWSQYAKWLHQSEYTSREEILAEAALAVAIKKHRDDLSKSESVDTDGKPPAISR